MNLAAHLNNLFEALVNEGKLAAGDWPAELGAPEDIGLITSGDQILLQPGVEFLCASDISNALSNRADNWLKKLEVYRVIGSTNDRLGLLADTQSVDGYVCLAELQIQGRGRRGRKWVSPFAGNVALSVGITLDKALHELGGLSLVVGLAALDCLQTLGVDDLGLKWPNDIFLGGRKLGGILIELKAQAGSATRPIEAVIGIGLNVDVSARVKDAVDQAITDLAAEGYRLSRNLLVARLVSSLVDYVKEFEEVGFAPMRELFNDHHLYHHQTCSITQGNNEVVGRVTGVTDAGEILLETGSTARAFAAGEVSLRQRC